MQATYDALPHDMSTMFILDIGVLYARHPMAFAHHTVTRNGLVGLTAERLDHDG